MKPLAWNHSERGIYDCSRGPPPPYAASKSIMDVSAVASRALVHPTPSHTTTSTKPATVTFQTFNQMVGTVQPIAQAQAYKPQQVHSNNESCSQNIFVYKTVSQPMCQTIYAPGTKQVTLQNKGSALSNNPAEPIALNGVVWMTAAGQMAQTVNNVCGVQFARMMQSHNPLHQNVKQTSKTAVSISPTAGGAPQGQLNVPDSQENHSSAQNLTAKDNSRCNDQTQIRSAFRKEDVFQDQSKTHSTVVGTAPARVLYRIWPAPPSYASVPQQIYGDRVKGDSSERAGSSVNLSQQQNGQHDVTNSNGQKRMMLARVTPMSQDWRNLQQNTNTFSAIDISKPKNLQLEDAQLHHKLGSNQESRTVNNAVSAFEQLFEMKNTTTPQLSAVRTSAQRNGSITSLVPPLLHKPSLHRQQNIHFIYTPATVSEQHTVTSSMSSLKAQHNATGPGNYNSISNTSSKDPVASQLPPLSAGQGIFGVSSSSLNLVSQQTMTVSSVGAGSLCNNDHQNVLLPSVVPHSTNMSCSTFRLESKEGGKHPAHMPSSGFSLTHVRFNQENSQSSSVHLSTTDDCGKQSATSLPLVPPSIVERNCRIMESSAVYTTSSASASEKDIPAKVIGGQVDTSNTVVETSFSMLEMSKYSATSAANLSGSSGQHCQEMLVHGSSTKGECSEQQKKCANSMPVLIRQPSPRDSSSSFELNGNKRNLTSDTEIYLSHTPTFCEVQENLAVNNSPPPKRFLASALEDASQDGRSCKNTILCPDKESINSPELLHNEGLDKSGATNVAQDEVGVQPDICITGVFSLGDDTGLWESVQQENLIDHINPDTSSSVLTSDEVHNSPGPKGLVTVESGMSGKTNRAKECNTNVVNEKGPVMCVPPSNLESSQCHSVTESPRMVHMQPVMERSFDKNIGELSGDSNDPANVLVDLTTADYCSSDSVLPCTFKEHETKLVSYKSCLPFEVNDQHPLPFDKETQDLDEVLHSVEAAIETLVNFWNPEYTPCTCGNAGKLTCKHNNLQGRTSESKLPNTEKADLNFCGAVQVTDKADLLKGPGCDLSTDVKVLGHVEILNLLAEISSSNQRLPAESAESEQFTHSIVRLNKETQQKASQNANGDESNEYGVKVLERKGRGYKGEPNCAPLQGLNNNNSTIQKGKQQEKKVYCCINAWLVASGVLGINCNCKLSQGSKPGSQTDLPTAVHKSQSSSETSNQNGFASQMEIEPTVNNVPFVTHENVLEISEMRNSIPSLVPDYNQEKPLGEVPPEVCSADAIQQTSEVRAIENEMENLWNPGNADLNSFNASDILTHTVGLEGKLQKKIEERKEVSLNVVENGPIKKDHTVLGKETDEDKTKNVRRDSSLNVLNKKASDQSDVLQFKQHIVKLGFKVMKRKADSTSCRSPQTKRKNGVQGKKIFVRNQGPQKSNHRAKTKSDFQDAKVLPKYNCRIMIQDKTYSSSGENAVLVSLVPLSGNAHKAMEKVDVKN